MAAPQQQEALFREGRVDLGVQAYKLGQITSLRGVERAYNVSRKTVKRRVSGIRPQRGSTASNCRLTSMCKSTEHIARTCPRRQATS